jgi:hypothetical protein
MSLKRSIQVLATVAAVFAFSAIAASAVLAAGDAPRWTIGGVTPTSGSTAFSATSTGSAGGGVGKLEVPGLFELTNPANKCTASGNIAGSAANTSGTVNGMVLKCHEISVAGLPKCVLEDETDTIPGTVTTETLKGTTVWLAATGDRAGVTFTPTAAGGSFAKLLITDNPANPGCIFTGLTVKIEGSVVGEAETVGVDATNQALNFPNPPITETWSNATPRVKAATFDALKVGEKPATFTDTFDITLTGSPFWGVETG